MRSLRNTLLAGASLIALFPAAAHPQRFADYHFEPVMQLPDNADLVYGDAGAIDNNGNAIFTVAQGSSPWRVFEISGGTANFVSEGVARSRNGNHILYSDGNSNHNVAMNVATRQSFQVPKYLSSGSISSSGDLSNLVPGQNGDWAIQSYNPFIGRSQRYDINLGTSPGAGLGYRPTNGGGFYGRSTDQSSKVFAASPNFTVTMPAPSGLSDSGINMYGGGYWGQQNNNGTTSFFGISGRNTTISSDFIPVVIDNTGKVFAQNFSGNTSNISIFDLNSGELTMVRRVSGSRPGNISLVEASEANGNLLYTGTDQSGKRFVGVAKPVPEPTGMLAIGLGLVALAAARRRGPTPPQ